MNGKSLDGKCASLLLLLDMSDASFMLDDAEIEQTHVTEKTIEHGLPECEKV